MQAITEKKTRPTALRVQMSTSPKTNERIRRETEARFTSTALAGPQAIEERLRELDQEWDIERMLQTNFSAVALLGVTFGALVARPWFLFSGIAAGFMLEHALKGWCPPVQVFRRLSYRTAREIDRERYALKAMRGDFRGAKGSPAKALEGTGLR